MEFSLWHREVEAWARADQITRECKFVELFGPQGLYHSWLGRVGFPGLGLETIFSWACKPHEVISPDVAHYA